MAASQLNHPWRAVARTIFAGVVALTTLIPVLVLGFYSDGNVPAILTQVVVVSGAITRFLANPKVNELIERFVPWLAPQPLNESAGSDEDPSTADSDEVFSENAIEPTNSAWTAQSS